MKCIDCGQEFNAIPNVNRCGNCLIDILNFIQDTDMVKHLSAQEYEQMLLYKKDEERHKYFKDKLLYG